MRFSIDFCPGEITLEQTLESFEQAAALVDKLWGAAALLWPQENAAHDAALTEAEQEQRPAQPVGGRRKGESGVTARQQQVLDLLKEGLSVIQVAEQLGVGQTYIYSLRRRFDLEGLLS